MTAPGQTPPQEISARHVEMLEGADQSDYWWYVVRFAHVRQALAAAPREDLRYLDVGCGTGGVLQAVLKELRPRLALGLDGTQAAVEIAQRRGLPARLADFRKPLEMAFRPNAVSCLDVLEHLEDPVLLLRSVAAVSEPGATLVVTVPAMPSLHSRWDELAGHHRRYTRELLGVHLREGGWRVVRRRHFFSYCVPPAWVQRRVLRRVPEMEFPQVSRPMNAALAWAGRVERALGCPLPFGTSLVAVATRD